MSNRAGTRESQVKSGSSLKALLLLVFISASFALCIVEVTTYFLPELIPVDIKAVFQNNEDKSLAALAFDEELGYVYNPGLADFPVTFTDNNTPYTYSISTVSLGYNRVGFRDDGLNGDPFAVVIGDSYSSCVGVALNDCWVELLENRLAKDFANLGVVGYSPQQEQRMLSRYGLPLNPRLVLWVFYANDVNDAWRFEQFGAGAAREGKFWQNPLRGWLARHSSVYAIVSFFWYNRYLFYNLATANSQQIPSDSNLIWLLTYTDLNVPQVAEGFALTKAAIAEAYHQTQAASRNTRFVVVIIPFREQVYYTGPALQSRLDSLSKAMGAFCREQGIPVIDLTEAVRARVKDEPESIYFAQDIHLRPRGNQIVAELLSHELSK